MTSRPDWRAVRAEFPALAHCVWLDTAGGAPIPRRAADAVQRFYADLAERRGDVHDCWRQQAEHVRGRAAALLNGRPGDVLFTAGVAEAMARCTALDPARVIDASSWLGARRADVEDDGIGALVSCGSKWLMAGPGIAVLWTRTHPSGGTDVAAGTGRHHDDPLLPGIFALGGSLDLLDEIGASVVEARIRELSGYLQEAVTARGFETRQEGATTLVVMHDPAAVTRRLAEAGIVVAAAEDAVRASLHVFNDEEDVDRLVAGLLAVRSGAPPPARTDVAAHLVCVDLNGVLDAYQGWRGADHWDGPAPGARAFLEALRARGCRVVVFTTRHYQGVWQWLDRHGLADFVDDVTDRKPAADVFVDDRAVCFRGDFDAALRQIAGFRAHWE